MSTEHTIFILRNMYQNLTKFPWEEDLCIKSGDPPLSATYLEGTSEVRAWFSIQKLDSVFSCDFHPIWLPTKTKYSSPNSTRAKKIKTRRIRWAGIAASMGETSDRPLLRHKAQMGEYGSIVIVILKFNYSINLTSFHSLRLQNQIRDRCYMISSNNGAVKAWQYHYSKYVQWKLSTTKCSYYFTSANFPNAANTTYEANWNCGYIFTFLQRMQYTYEIPL
jgi:hypothetical protein